MNIYQMIFITGPDAKNFLQGQLTCDVNALIPEKMQFTACCNLQGRIESLFFIVLLENNAGYALLLPDTECDYTLKHFKKYALFSKIAFEKKEQSYIEESETWHREQILKKMPILYPQTRGHFLPHRIGLQHIEGAISFNKGCYLGQEIIARMHFKATIKDAVYLEESDIAYRPGDTVENMGEIIDIAPKQETAGYYVLASHRQEA